MSPIKSKIPNEERPYLDRLLDEIRYLLSSVEDIDIAGQAVPRYTGEFWTTREQQVHSLHDVSYRSSFKPQLPRFFIQHLTNKGDTVYDPFSGRGTTALEAGLLARKVIANDANPLSVLLSKPRFFPPALEELVQRLDSLPINENEDAEIDLSMFFHPKTEAEIVSIKNYLSQRHESSTEDYVDRWIRMVATNRLTGHSKGFFSVYTVPPNQSVSAAHQQILNMKTMQTPEQRDTRVIIFKKSKALLSDLTTQHRQTLQLAGDTARFYTCDARETKAIASNSVQLTVTSPPSLEDIEYAQDNWLRCWFNNLEAEDAAKRITMSRTLAEWSAVMFGVFRELHRITKPRGFVAFEVGEVKNKKIRLDEHVVPLGIKAGFSCIGIIKNEHHSSFTTTKHKADNQDLPEDHIVLFRK